MMEFNHSHPILSLGLVGIGLSPTNEIIPTFITEYGQVLFDLRWMIILGVFLVISDFWFGISESRVKKKKIRRSSAWRRTLNKSIDYFCYITLGSILGRALGEYYGFDPILISVSVILLCYAFEIDSIYGHICAIHGIKKHYSIWRLIGLLFSFKFKHFKESLGEMNEQSKKFKEKQTNKTT